MLTKNSLLVVVLPHAGDRSQPADERGDRIGNQRDDEDELELEPDDRVGQMSERPEENRGREEDRCQDRQHVFLVTPKLDHCVADDQCEADVDDKPGKASDYDSHVHLIIRRPLSKVNMGLGGEPNAAGRFPQTRPASTVDDQRRRA
jgi:hypothetical protein